MSSEASVAPSQSAAEPSRLIFLTLASIWSLRLPISMDLAAAQATRAARRTV